MKTGMDLHYDLRFGALTAHAEGLLRGVAIGAKCTQCGFVSFPPVPVCNRCHGRTLAEHRLAGTAAIITMTGSDRPGFGLVQFDGSDTPAIARLEGLDWNTKRGRLIPPGTAAAGIWLGAIDPQMERKD